MRKQLLIMAASASVVITVAAGYYYWDAIALGALAALLWVKKLASLQGLLMLAKKLPFLLILGLKRLVIHVTADFLLFSAHLRFRLVRRTLRYLRWRAWKVRNRLKNHWDEMGSLEQWLLVGSALPLTAVLTLLLVLLFLPPTLLSLVTRKLKEHSSAAVLKKVAHLGARERLEVVDRRIRQRLRRKLKKKRT